MAKKKKRHPAYSARSSTGGGVATTTGRGAGAAPTVKPAPAEPGGPNRLARKEEARRQREAIQRRIARRRVLRRAGIAALVVAVVAGVSAYVALKPNPAKAAGCGAVQTIRPYPNNQDRAHINAQGVVKTPPALSTYPSTPPASGPHNLSTLAAGVYASPPEVDKTIHSLEHGSVIIWYNPQRSSSSELQKIESLYRQTASNDHVIVAPYNYPDQGAAGHLAAGKSMVLVAWHHVQSCTSINLAAAKSFVAGYRTPTGSVPNAYKGDAPEAGSAI
jgi:hypothetical protein